jgi:hypothetical protein
MRRPCQLVSMAVLVLVRPALTEGQRAMLSLDLGKQSPGAVTTESVPAGTYSVRIDNRVPRLPYSVNVIVRSVAYPPISISGTRASSLAACSAITQADADLSATYQRSGDETEIRTQVEAALRVLNSTPGCTAEADSLSRRIDESRISWSKDIALEAGQELVITVVRPAQPPEPEKTWQKTFTTGPRGEWRTSYGFATIFTRLGPGSGVFSKRTSVFIQTAGDANTIAERNDRGAADLVPAVLFHFMPSGRTSASLVRGASAGVSFDGTNPMIMGGLGWTYEQNVNLSFGLMARREPILLAKYELGQKVAADLTEGQLTEMKLRIRPYVVLTFRLSASPFGSGEQPKEKPKGG